MLPGRHLFAAGGKVFAALPPAQYQIILNSSTLDQQLIFNSRQLAVA